MPRPRRRYRKIADGEWIVPVKRAYYTQCCDCGLVHRLDFKIVDGAIHYRAVRDKRATAAARRAFCFIGGDTG